MPVIQKSKTERIEIDLPQDIIFAMRGLEKPEELKNKLKMALAILLFQERVISLGKATELAGMSRVKFMNVLKDHDIFAYDYSKEDFKRDQQIIDRYRESGEK